MRLSLLCAILAAFSTLAPIPIMAQTAPQYHNDMGDSGASYSGNYSGNYSGGYTAHNDDYKPIISFYYFPRGIPQYPEHLNDTRKPGFRYYPYYEYRSYYPTDQYDRNKSQRYPVR